MLIGETKSYGAGDPWPVVLPGQVKPIMSTKIGEYVNEEFVYYYKIYTHIKHAGNPFSGGWNEWPLWVLQLLEEFDSCIEHCKRYREKQAYSKMRLR